MTHTETVISTKAADEVTFELSMACGETAYVFGLIVTDTSGNTSQPATVEIVLNRVC